MATIPESEAMSLYRSLVNVARCLRHSEPTEAASWTVVRVLEAQFDGRCSLRTFAIQILRNRIFDEWRRSKNRTFVSLDSGNIPAGYQARHDLIGREERQFDQIEAAEWIERTARRSHLTATEKTALNAILNDNPVPKIQKHRVVKAMRAAAGRCM